MTNKPANKLPEWILEAKHVHHYDPVVTRFIEALSIAWEALEHFQSHSGGHCCEDCPCGYWETNTKDAMRRIEELGK